MRSRCFRLGSVLARSSGRRVGPRAGGSPRGGSSARVAVVWLSGVMGSASDCPSPGALGRGRLAFFEVASQCQEVLRDHRVVDGCSARELRGFRRDDLFVLFCPVCDVEVGLDLPASVPLFDRSPLPFFPR